MRAVCLPLPVTENNKAIKGELLIDFDKEQMYFKSSSGDIVEIKQSYYQGFNDFIQDSFKSYQGNYDIVNDDYTSPIDIDTMHVDSLMVFDETPELKIINGVDKNVKRRSVHFMVMDKAEGKPVMIMPNVLLEDIYSFKDGVHYTLEERLAIIEDTLNVDVSDIGDTYHKIVDFQSAIANYAPKGVGYNNTNYPSLKHITNAVEARTLDSTYSAKMSQLDTTISNLDRDLRQLVSDRETVINNSISNARDYTDNVAIATEMALKGFYNPKLDIIDNRLGDIEGRYIPRGSGYDIASYPTLKALADHFQSRYNDMSIKKMEAGTYSGKGEDLYNNMAVDYYTYPENNITQRTYSAQVAYTSLKGFINELGNKKFERGNVTLNANYDTAEKIINKLTQLVDTVFLKGGALEAEYDSAKKMQDILKVVSTGGTAGLPKGADVLDINYDTALKIINILKATQMKKLTQDNGELFVLNGSQNLDTLSTGIYKINDVTGLSTNPTDVVRKTYPYILNDGYNDNANVGTLIVLNDTMIHYSKNLDGATAFKFVGDISGWEYNILKSSDPNLGNIISRGHNELVNISDDLSGVIANSSFEHYDVTGLTLTLLGLGAEDLYTLWRDNTITTLADGTKTFSQQDVYNYLTNILDNIIQVYPLSFSATEITNKIYRPVPIDFGSILWVVRGYDTTYSPSTRIPIIDNDNGVGVGYVYKNHTGDGEVVQHVYSGHYFLGVSTSNLEGSAGRTGLLSTVWGDGAQVSLVSRFRNAYKYVRSFLITINYGGNDGKDLFAIESYGSAFYKRPDIRGLVNEIGNNSATSGSHLLNGGNIINGAIIDSASYDVALGGIESGFVVGVSDSIGPGYCDDPLAVPTFFRVEHLNPGVSYRQVSSNFYSFTNTDSVQYIMENIHIQISYSSFQSGYESQYKPITNYIGSNMTLRWAITDGYKWYTSNHEGTSLVIIGDYTGADIDRNLLEASGGGKLYPTTATNGVTESIAGRDNTGNTVTRVNRSGYTYSVTEDGADSIFNKARWVRGKAKVVVCAYMYSSLTDQDGNGNLEAINDFIKIHDVHLKCMQYNNAFIGQTDGEDLDLYKRVNDVDLLGLDKGYTAVLPATAGNYKIGYIKNK